MIEYKLNTLYNLIKINGEIKDDISEAFYKEHLFIVKYNSGPKKYFYSRNSIEIIKKPEIFDEKSDFFNKKFFYNEGKLITGYKKILCFSGYFYRFVFEKGNFITYNGLKIVDNLLKDKSTVNTIKYFKNIIPLINSNEMSNFLLNQYEKINFINPESFLYYYLSKNNKIYENKNILNIFPFDFNLSQKEAIENIYKSNISVIKGPPGTGKTQTILNIISNLIIQNKKIAIVSGNNSATSNIKEKFEKYGYDFLIASLGNNENKDLFFNNIQEIKTFKSNKSEENNLDYTEKLKEISYLMEISNNKSILENKLEDYKLEQKYFNNYFEKQKVYSYENINFNYSKDILKFLHILDKIDNLSKIKSFFQKIKIFLNFGHKIFLLLKEDKNILQLNLQKLYYELKIKEIIDEIEGYKNILKNKNFNSLTEEYKFFSKNKFEDYLNKNFIKSGEINFTKENYLKNFGDFIKRFPIILSTTHSIKNSIPNGFLFDYLIIDESSQVDIITGSLSFSCAKNIILVGDNKQLSHIVKDPKIFENDTIEDCYNFRNNILESINLIFKENIPEITLKEHYRCHPKIIDFCNKKYYNNELIIHSSSENKYGKPLELIYTSEGNHMRNINGEGLEKGRYNKRELEEIINILKIENIKEEDYKNIGIITPFRKQVIKGSEILDDKIQIDTIHKYQGREKDIIFMSTVLSGDGNFGNDFVDNPNLINVSVSRAKNKFILVTDKKAFSNGNDLKDLIGYIEYNSEVSEVRKGKIISVFDLLYKDFSDNLKELNENIKGNSSFKSENIFETLLKNKILNKEEFNNLGYFSQYKLKNLVIDYSLFNYEEKKFINSNSSIDFIIYSKFSKKVILAIEIDGFLFHENNKKQQSRDEIKNSILKKLKIELLRLETNGSNEEEKINLKLKEILNKK